MMQQLKHIKLEMTLEDGTVVQGTMSSEYPDQRWGADLPALCSCVGPMEAMDEALREGGHWAAPGEEEPEEDAQDAEG